jgi:hypothetical protein
MRAIRRNRDPYEPDDAKRAERGPLASHGGNDPSGADDRRPHERPGPQPDLRVGGEFTSLVLGQPPLRALTLLTRLLVDDLERPG